jgi:hypothetical protein
MKTIRLEILATFVMLGAVSAHAASVVVKHAQGMARGFLIVRSESGAFLATGDLSQVATGNRVRSTLTFKFRDGSLDEETSIFSQAGSFKLIEDHHVQRGPSFPEPIDMLVETSTGTVTMRSTDKDGKVSITSEHHDLPDDLCNGMVGTLLLNLDRNAISTEWHMLAPTGKGRLVKLVATSVSASPFRIAGVTKTASLFRLHVDLGGITGVVAPMIGKEPKDISVLMLQGEAPALIRMVGQLYNGGPVVSIELAGASFPVRSGPK